MVSYLAVLLGLAVAVNLLLFLVAYRYRTDKLTDISYALTFMLLAAIGLMHSNHSLPAWILAAMIFIWAIRLGGFLLIRIWHTGRDKRFDAMRSHFWSFGKFWLAQGLSVWFILIAPLEGFRTLHTNFPLWSIGGIAVWCIGLVIETTADLQKYRFSHQPKNKDHWIHTGVWSWSRHPNYFGEMLIWIGAYLFVVPLLPMAAVLVGVLSPLFIISLLLFVSGLPPLEKSADSRWGKNPKYQDYKRHTSILIPWPPRQ